MELKQKLYMQCVQFCNNRLDTIRTSIEEIQESLTSETKSSAGDKHETGRAMLQLEREKAGNQLAETEKLQELLSKIDVSKTSKTVCLGSLVFTTQANFYSYKLWRNSCRKGKIFCYFAQHSYWKIANW
jgi:hypothetical protein